MIPIDQLLNTIMFDDVLDGLRKIPDETVHLVCTSPPYNINIKYKNRKDNDPYAHYLAWLKDILIECKRVLVSGGRIAINIDSVRNLQDGEEYMRPIYADLVNIGREIGLKFRVEICWYKQNWSGRATAFGSWCSCSNPALRRTHEYVLVWSKDEFGLEGDSELSDMTPKEFQEWTFSTWFIQPETKNRNGHPAPYPEELVTRILKLFSYRGNTILDPFMGTGTTGAVAKMTGRNYIGIDNSEGDVKYARDRINNIANIFEPYVPRSQRLKESKAEIPKEVVENEVF